MSNALRVEALTAGLKQVRNAKDSLENRLQERRAKRKELETVYENVNSKLTQVKELQSKMMGTMRTAQHKVSQTQALCDSMEASNGDKRAYLQKLDAQIKAEEDGRMDDVQLLQENLSKISKTMVEAKHFYSETNLKATIQKVEEECENHTKECVQFEEDERELEKYLTSLGVNQHNREESGIDKQAVWDMFRNHQKSLLRYLQTINRSVQEKKLTVST